jgi:4-diphosphocytidyl-2-C-methyl-D-erythritol kinase
MDMLAFAKINLSLSVLFRRSDGYHEIESLAQTVDLADRVSVELSNGAVRVDNDLDELRGTDLAERAAAAILAKRGVDCGARIRVRKGIPAGAGLGGGSSDAAAVLWSLNQLVRPPLPPAELLDLAAQVGSDVPLFLVGGRVHLSGRGARVTAQAPCPRETFVLIVPPVHCETARVYGRWKPTAAEGGGTRHRGLTMGENALLDPALSLYPELRKYYSTVSRLDALYAGMSGSGSSFYAAFRAEPAAQAAARAIEARFPELRVFLCSATDVGQRVSVGEVT